MGPADFEESFVIAVLPEEAQKVASGIVRGKKFSITLLSEVNHPLLKAEAR